MAFDLNRGVTNGETTQKRKIGEVSSQLSWGSSCVNACKWEKTCSRKKSYTEIAIVQ